MMNRDGKPEPRSRYVPAHAEPDLQFSLSTIIIAAIGVAGWVPFILFRCGVDIEQRNIGAPVLLGTACLLYLFGRWCDKHP